jgi:hypothetical protein
VHLYRNDAGLLGPPQRLAPVPGDCRAVTWVDFDSDGDLDLAAVAGSTGVLLLRAQDEGFVAAPRLDGDGDGDGASPTDCVREPTPDAALRAGHRTMVWLDADLDGDEDVLLPQPGQGCLSPPLLYVNRHGDGEARFDARSLDAIAPMQAPAAAVAADLDADGDLDVVVHDEGTGRVALLQGNAADNRGTSAAPLGTAQRIRVELPSGAAAWGVRVELSSGRVRLVYPLAAGGRAAQGPATVHVATRDAWLPMDVRAVLAGGEVVRGMLASALDDVVLRARPPGP